MKQTFKFSTFLLLFALSFGFNQEAKAWALRIPGSWDGWSTTGSFVYDNSGTAEYFKDVTAGTYTFKVYIDWGGTNQKWYSLNNKSMTDGCSYFQIYENNGDMTFKSTYNARYKFGVKDDSGIKMWVERINPYTKLITTGSNTAYLGDKLGEWNVNWAIYDVGTWTSSKVRIGTSSSSYSEYDSSSDGTYGNGIKVKTNLSGFQFTTTGTYKVFGVLNYCNTNYCTNGDNSTQNTNASTAFNNSPLTWTVSAIPAPSNFTATAQSSSSIKLSWSLNTASHYVIIIQDEDDVPTNGTNYNKGDSFGAGKVVYIGNSTSTTISNLAAGTNHTYYIYSVNNGYYSTGSNKSARTYYTVTYKPGTNGTGSESFAEKIPSQSLTLKGVTFTRNGYMQDGWATSDGGEKAYELGASYTTDANIILYPTWHVQTYPVTFGVHTSGNGSLGATVGGNAISSGAQVDASATVVFTATPAIGYEVEGWYSNEECTSKIAGTGTSTTYNATISAATTVYVKFKAKQFTITYKDQGNVNFSGTHQSGYPTKHTYDQVTTLDSPTKIGYEFQGWHKQSNCSDAAVTTIGAQEITDNITLYAKWQINTYNITYPASPAHYTITENTTSGDYNTSASFKATPAKGYLLTVTATKGSSPVSLNRNGDTYSFNIPDGDVTITVVANPYQLQGNFINHGGSFDDTKYDFDNNFQYKITLNATTDYTFKLRNESATGHYLGNSGAITSTITDPWDFSTSVNNSCTIKTGVAGTYIFTYTEKNDGTPQILVTYPEGNMVVVDMSGSEKQTLALNRVGDKWVSESITLAQNKSYTFQLFYEGAAYGNNGTMTQSNHTGWTMSTTERNKPWLNTENTDHSAGDYFFEFDASTKKLSAVYPSFFKCSALDDWEHKPITFENNVKTIEIESNGTSDFEFLFINDGLYYGKSDNTTIDRSTSFTLTNSNWKNVIVTATEGGAGTYMITFDQSTKLCQVTFPDNTTYDVTVYLDGKTPTLTQAGPSGGIGIRAADKLGYRFKEWVISGTAGAARVAETNQQSTTLYCDAAGGVVTATYENSEFIYFKNIPGWSEVNVYFYSEDYFDPNNGSGCLADKDENKRKAYGWAMTHIPNTDIWYLDYKNMDRKPNVNIVAFSDHLQNTNQWFYECQVAYRKDFSTCTPMYMPVNWIHERLNNGKTAYYEQGCWMKYDSQESGYEVKLYDRITDGGNEMAHVDLTADGAGGYVFTGTININFEGKSEGWNYGFKIKNKCNSTYFGNNGTMTSTNCTNWEFNSASDMQNCGLTTTTKGNYTFTISFDGGIMHVSVEYPVSNGDYRVVYKEGVNAPLWNGYYYKKSNTDRKDTASFFIENGVSATVELQRGTDVSADPAVWETVIDINTSSFATGVYNFEISQTNEGANATLTSKGLYTGNYYIRTDGVDGGWKGFAKNPDNLMTYYGSMLDAGDTYGNFHYDYYKAKWIEYNKNVKFCIANDYSKNISAEFAGDATLKDQQVLPQNTNVRFMWNSETNQLSRAYISGSTNIADRFLVMIGDEKMFDKDGNPLDIPGLNPNEINFADNNNWVYQADIKAKPGCAVQLIATYNGTIQYFIGSDTETKTIISGGANDKQYTMRAVYDFKTNRLIVGWIPPAEDIDEDITLGGDMLLIRVHQEDVQQIVFNQPTTKVSDIQHIYGVLTLQKTQMINTTNADYEKTMYWISFPFDVKLSEVFGTGIYGTDWIVQRYRGDLRAQKGWFKQDTPTFWEYMELTDTLKAYEGYVFLVDANKFNSSSSEAWKNSATEANFYFPSASGEIGIIHQATYPQTVPKHVCTIDREFEVADVGIVNHMNTDSHWNVIGVPAFQNNIPSATPLCENFKSYYEWDHSTNKYKAEVVLQGTEFHTMHAYMVQFAGTITWSDVSVVKQNAPSRELAAQYADAQSYLITLRINDGKDDDKTFIRLAENADTEFVLNEDMMKMDNTGSPNIYSFAGNYNVAYNETSLENQTINLGVNVPKNGNYTFSMPDSFNGKATLVDAVEGKVTELNVSDYTVTLNKGTYNNRFQLVLTVNSPIVTNVDEINDGWNADGKTKKLLINNTIYLINNGRIYNASGMELTK